MADNYRWYAVNLLSNMPQSPYGWYDTRAYGGVGDIWYDRACIAGEVLLASPGDTIEWATQWLPTTLGATWNTRQPAGPDPETLLPKYAWGTHFAGIAVNMASMGSTPLGELRLFATVNGVQVPGYMWLVTTGVEYAYPAIAWGVQGADAPPAASFWTSFTNTQEFV